LIGTSVDGETRLRDIYYSATINEHWCERSPVPQ